MGCLIKKLLIVGFGSMGKRHTRLIREYYPHIELKVLTRTLLDKGSYEEENLGFYTSINEALEFKPDAAIIANPATKHLDISKLLAEQGTHLLIEKPIATETTGVQSLIDVCKQHSVILMTAYNFRFLPTLIEFSRLLEQEKIGKVLSVRAEVGSYLPDWRPNSDYRKNVSSQKILGGGVILELSHEIDYLSWIFGPIKWVKAHASKQSNLEIDVEDTVQVIFGCEKLKKYELTGSLCMDFIRRDPSRFCLAIGEKGSLLWDGISGEVKLFSDTSNEWNVIFSDKPPRDFTYAEEIKHFFSSIEHFDTPISSGEDGLKTLFIIDAIKRSSKIDSLVYV
jgi:predicted dehydrogenase